MCLRLLLALVSLCFLLLRDRILIECEVYPVVALRCHLLRATCTVRYRVFMGVGGNFSRGGPNSGSFQT